MSRVGADGRTNRRTPDFRGMFAHLPERIRERARKTFEIFLENPHHSSLRLHQLKDTGTSSHEPESFSVSVTMGYRAIYFVDATENVNVWYWIGSHADYDRLTS